MFKQNNNTIDEQDMLEPEDDMMYDEVVETVVGPSVNVEGDFTSEGNITVKGTVSGNVETSRMLTVEEGARIYANVKAAEALVSGDIQGNVKVAGRLELTATAQILGDVTCGELVIAGGARLKGKVSMDGIDIPPSDKRSSSFARKTRRTTKKTTTETEEGNE